VTDAVLSVDVGGTTIAAGLVTATGTALCTVGVPTQHTHGGRDPGLVQLADVVAGIRRQAADDGHVVRAVSLGFPEYVHHDRLTSAEVIAWERQPTDVLGDAAGSVPVFVESDVRCAAVAESLLAPAGEEDIFYVSWGTGISSTLVVDGTCRAGRRGEAIALGELDVPASVDKAWNGTLERYASGSGIAERYAEAHPESNLDCRAIAALAATGDVDATAIIRSAARAVAAALRSCIALLDPDVVIVGGGIGTSAGPLIATMRTELERGLRRPAPPAVVAARAGEHGGLIGAGLVGWRRLGAPPPACARSR
jgi:glucokinase